jgi:hypothetical protein
MWSSSKIGGRERNDGALPQPEDPIRQDSLSAFLSGIPMANDNSRLVFQEIITDLQEGY